uniref:Uncharacterized protein n=1 Tax=Meloidogyne incognita TaxID=6306 RepID=A0A914LIM3_MELIC
MVALQGRQTSMIENDEFIDEDRQDNLDDDFPDVNNQIFGRRRRQPNAQPRRINHWAIFGNNYRGGHYNQATGFDG